MKTLKFAFEINWPLADMKYIKCGQIIFEPAEWLGIISFDLPAGQFCSSELSLQSSIPSQRYSFGIITPPGHV